MTPRTHVVASVVSVALTIGAAFAVLAPASASVHQSTPAAQHAKPPPTFSVSAVAAGVRSAGGIGASGGLVTLDSASAYVTDHLDSAPSATVLADPYEPGTLARTGVGQVNSAAGKSVLDVPDAESEYPGSQHKAELHAAPNQHEGPLTAHGGDAAAATGRRTATGSSSAQATTIGPTVSTGSSTSSAALTTAKRAARISGSATSAVSGISAGVLRIKSVRATAVADAAGRRHTATSSLTVGGATVAGQPVTIDETGVHVTGKQLPTNPLTGALTSPEKLLATAGIKVRTFRPVHRHDSRSATADSGGLQITLRSDALPDAVGGNTVTLLIAAITVTESDGPGVASPVPSGPPPSSSTRSSPARPGIPGTPGRPASRSTGGAGAAPVVAAARPAEFARLIGGLSGRWALLAFALFQALTLNAATIYAIGARRRARALQALS